MDLNAAFHRSWFGPFPYSDIYGYRRRMRPLRSPFFAFNQGPFDGPLSAGIHAWRFAQLPVSYPSRYWMGDENDNGNGNGPVFCPPGHMPVQTGVPGRSKCVLYSPPGTMIGPSPSTTVSTMVPPAYPTAKSFPVGPYWGWEEMSGAARGPRLGQEVFTVEQAERDRIVNEISAALAKVPPLDDLIAYSSKSDPDLRRTLGQDATRFFALSNSIAPLFEKVRAVQLRMSDPDPEFWNAPDAAEQAAIKQWTTGVSEMHKIYMAHKDLPVEVPVGTPPPPGFTRVVAPGVSPGGQVSPGGAPTGRPTAGPTAGPQATGPSTSDLLIGGGIAVGLGLVIALLVS